MAETTPGTAVESLDQGAVETALEGIFGDAPEPEEEQEAAEGQPDEPTSDDIADEDGEPEPVSATEFEIVHNGQQHKLSREETIRLAQQGFDYTQKTQALAQRRAEADAVLQRATAVEQLSAHVAQELAAVKALEAQVAQWANVDWVKLATDDPLEYPRMRAQYDRVAQAYQGAVGQFQAKAQAVAQERHQLASYTLAQEAAALRERIPEWRDPEKYQRGAQELSQWLLSQGADPDRVSTLTSSLEVDIARKAMLYDKLVREKSAKSKQLRGAPPVVRPGASNPDAGKTSFQKAGKEFRRLGRAGNNKAQEKVLEGLLSRTFK